MNRIIQLTALGALSIASILPGIQAAQDPVDSTAWAAAVQHDLMMREYWITWQERTRLDELHPAWQGPNRAQGFRAYFTTSGVRLFSRTNDTSDWGWRLSLAGYGRGAESFAVEPARLFPDKNQLRLDRHEIEERFVNEPGGLTHGVILHSPPNVGSPAIAGSSLLHLNLSTGASLRPMVSTDGRSVRFVGSASVGQVHYDHLGTRDATGRELPSWIELRINSGIWAMRVFVDDRGAVYPIAVDSLVTTAAWIGEIDLANSAFGSSVATAGDVNGDGYDDIIVGAFHFDNGDVNEGAAFLYLGAESGPTTGYDWMVAGPERVAFAGESVGTAGDVNGDGYDDVIVGIPLVDNGEGAWVFHGSPTGLSDEPDWIGHGGAGNSYGAEVATAGDVNGDGYDDVIVGASRYDQGGFLQEGAAYVYHGSAVGLDLGASWFTKGNQQSAAYGSSVGTVGDVNGDGYDDAIVGAYEFDNGETDEGKVFLYYGSASGLSTTPDWTFENDIVRACLGVSAGSAGDVNGDGYDDAIVGAAFQACWNAPASPVGKAYTFLGSADGLGDEPNSTMELGQLGAIFGDPVAAAGDLNEDGYDDVLVGAQWYDNGETNEGAVFLYQGSQAGVTSEVAWKGEGNQDESYYGASAGTAGDVDGDGVGDVIVGAFWYDNGETDEGAAFLYHGSGVRVPAGAVPADMPLILDVTSSHGLATLHLSWGTSCLASDIDYEVYEGQLGDFTSHSPRTCSTGGQTSTNFLVPSGGATYYLVVPRSQSSEGSYGRTSEGVERPPGQTEACLPQSIGSCE